MDRLLAKEPLNIPVMLVHSLWDQEDIYGAPAVYRAIEPKDTGNDKVFLVLGPWHHGQGILEGSTLGDLEFDSDTALTFRQRYLRPFLAQYLKNGAPKADIPPVAAFETGTNAWKHYPAWPAPGTATPLYLAGGGRLSLGSAAPGSQAAVAEYVSDPARPVPYIPRPVLAGVYDKGTNWKKWLVSDQRESSGRTDVAVFVTEGSAVWSTRTFSVISGAVSFASSTSSLVQVTSWPVTSHVQPEPEASVGVRPAGRVSVTVVVPLVERAPRFCTEME